MVNTETLITVFVSLGQYNDYMIFPVNRKGSLYNVRLFQICK